MGPGGVGQLAAGHAEDLDGRRRPALTEFLAEAPVRLVAVVGRPPVDAQQLRVVAALVEQPELLGGDGAVVRGPEEPRVHFFVAYLCSLPPALAHHAAHANYSKMLRLALFDKGAGGEAGVRAAAAVEALDLYVAGCRPVDLDARFLYAYAEDVAATCPAASLLSLPRVQHCDGCGLRQPGMARCSRCRHVAYCSDGCQRAAWARRHRKTVSYTHLTLPTKA